MQTVNVSLKHNSYKICIGCRVLPQLGKLLRALSIGQDAVIITNGYINKLYGKAVVSILKKSGFSAKVFLVPDSEESKSADVVFDLIKKIAAYDVKKNIFIIAFGGGVVGDAAGFVASMYKRGIPYIQVPTTLLAQIDSAIGGKVAIDLSVGKNLVGAFYQPRLVLSDTALLATLDKRQIRNGLAEAVKYGVIRDRRLFNYISNNYKKLLSCDLKALAEVVRCCSKIKAGVVSADEKERKGIRTILNFGHTLGHAIETAGGYRRYHHGEAIALGMRIAADISCRLGVMKEGDSLRLGQLLSSIGLPSAIKGVRASDITEAVSHDKKFRDRKNRFVLPTKIGQVRIVEGVPIGIITQVIKTYL
ncbi:MAG TPA: 3-dehydroquinate synthase [Candidatus Omnitrophota bacterium]|nr:3-dehydroquinate synthase [Candidatus Omnitrophota bacterium]HPD83898.1 3-dehydroquinate synthase [Candidatus Omnitrophota bacterium]HRZ02755.1 3-dehydroquinate synthase [Candidatus Omnitrophota bacterium]